MIKLLLRYFNTYLKYALLVMIACLLVIKARKTAAIHFDMDNMAQQLSPIQQSIKPGSKIGFASTYTDPGLFIQVQYLLAPQVLTAAPVHDTLLVINKKGQHGKESDPAYRMIKQSDNNGMVVSLISKVK